MAAYRTHVLPLAQTAAERALAQAEIEPDQVSQLITISCTGFSAPGLDVELIDNLGLSPEVGRTMVGFMGCHGALNGLRVARGLAAEPGGIVLLCAVELCTLHFQYGGEPDQVLANALFADGAGAAVAHHDASEATAWHVEAAPGNGERPSNGRPRPAAAGWRLRDARSTLLPDSREDMQWHITEHGFTMRLSKRVPGLIEQHLGPWLIDWLNEHDLDLSAVAHWAIHPGGPRVISAVEQALELEDGAGDLSRQVLADYGNMSSPTLLFILQRLAQQRIDGPCVALGFGPGLVVEAALLDYVNAP
jgi:predicted naringenin-chalcone synthase